MAKKSGNGVELGRGRPPKDKPIFVSPPDFIDEWGGFARRVKVRHGLVRERLAWMAALLSLPEAERTLRLAIIDRLTK